jgi:hypothetical protein
MDSMFSPRFFLAVERNPRTCEAATRWPSRSRPGPLLWVFRSVPESSRSFVLGARRLGFLRGLRGPRFLGGCGLGALDRASWPLGVSFFGLASYFESAFTGATGAPCAATAAVVSGLVASAFVTVLFGPFGG